MSLLVTSCTMGQQPVRLLDKGPQYLRTRTNRGLFAHHRKSAVELLAASKSQFYKCPSVSLDDTHHVSHLSKSGILGQSGNGAWQNKTPSRSKSEFDISTLKCPIEDNEDENGEVFISSSHDTNLGQPYPDSSLTRTTSDSSQPSTRPRTRSNRASLPNIIKPRGKEDISVLSKLNARDQNDNYIITDEKEPVNEIISPGQNTTLPQSLSPEDSTPKRPIPLPRKPRGTRPVPPPRKPVTKEVFNNTESIKTSLLSTKDNTGNSLNSNQSFNKYHKASGVEVRRKSSLVENLKQHFTSLTSSNLSHDFSTTPKQHIKQTKERTFSADNGCSHKAICENISGKADTYQATPIFIFKPKSTEENDWFTSTPNQRNSLIDTTTNNSVSSSVDKTRERRKYSNVSMSDNSGSRRDRKLSNTNSTSGNSASVVFVENILEDPSSVMSSSLTPGVIVEMSIESVDQAVCCDSEVNAIPAAVTTSAESLGGGQSIGNSREVARNSPLIGRKMDTSFHEATLRTTHSPTHFNPPIPRSHSDISCRLEIESQHSRDSSLVSNHSRLSRVSAGANLEQFFNQMGLEKGVLEPLNRLKELQNSDVLASVSSLDSHDAASICSTFSGNDNDNSESQNLDPSQHTTSVVERNARIIKWLCNVRKAKIPLFKTDAASGDGPRPSSADGGDNG